MRQVETRITLSRVAPAWGELVPWTDKRGRFDPLRAAVFAALLAPGVWLMARWLGGMLGPDRYNAAIHSSGYTAIWLLIGSMVITPLKALSGTPGLAVLRRMVGNAALGYSLLHVVLYAAGEDWQLGTVVLEIIKRFYLTIGFAAVCGLVVLGVTSTDGWAQALGRRWKRLHRGVYAIVALGLVHYVLQSKLDVSQAMLAIGMFGWLMLWRALPAGRDRTWLPLLGISLAATALTVAAECLWYKFGTRIDPVKVVLSEFDVGYGLHPAGQVLLAGLCASGLVLLRAVGQEGWGRTAAFSVVAYGLGAFVDDLAALVIGWPLGGDTAGDVAGDVPGMMGVLALDGVWFVLLGALGLARWMLREHGLRRWVDAVWLACVLHNVLLAWIGSSEAGAGLAAVLVGASVVLGARVWPVSRLAAATLVPIVTLLAVEASSLL